MQINKVWLKRLAFLADVVLTLHCSLTRYRKWQPLAPTEQEEK